MSAAAKQAIQKLATLSRDDPESAHSDRDDILMELLDTLAPEVATAAREAEMRIGFWYA